MILSRRDVSRASMRAASSLTHEDSCNFGRDNRRFFELWSGTLDRATKTNMAREGGAGEGARLRATRTCNEGINGISTAADRDYWCTTCRLGAARFLESAFCPGLVRRNL